MLVPPQGFRLSRRRALACALAAAASPVVRVLAEDAPPASKAYRATEISQAAQRARRDLGYLVRQTEDLLRQVVEDGFERAPNAVRRFRAEQPRLSRDLAAVFNGGVSEDDWLVLGPTSELDLALAMQPLAIRLAPTFEEAEASLKRPLAQVKPSGDIARTLLALILDTLGLKSSGALIERLMDDQPLASALAAAGAALSARRYGLAALDLERLMRIVSAPRIMATLADALGRDEMRRIYRAYVARFAPFVGWSYFDALLLVTIYDNRERLAPLLR